MFKTFEFQHEDSSHFESPVFSPGNSQHDGSFFISDDAKLRRWRLRGQRQVHLPVVSADRAEGPLEANSTIKAFIMRSVLRGQKHFFTKVAEVSLSFALEIWIQQILTHSPQTSRLFSKILPNIKPHCIAQTDTSWSCSHFRVHRDVDMKGNASNFAASWALSTADPSVWLQLLHSFPHAMAENRQHKSFDGTPGSSPQIQIESEKFRILE